jgi:hypothetical protein
MVSKKALLSLLKPEIDSVALIMKLYVPTVVTS